MGEKLTKSGGLGANTVGEIAVEKKMANRSDDKQFNMRTLIQGFCLIHEVRYPLIVP
jgi:hypothetical protein